MHVRDQILSVFTLLVLSAAAMFYVGGGPSLWAQSTNTGIVAGTVTDPSNAVVNAATVTITDTATKTSRSVATNDTGRYIFVDVVPGAYDLTVSKQGFSTIKTQATVKVGATTTANMTLQVGGSNVVVEVTAVGNELQTMNATVGNTITNLTIDNLPSLGRDVSTFIALQPAVSPDGRAGRAIQLVDCYGVCQSNKRPHPKTQRPDNPRTKRSGRVGAGCLTPQRYHSARAAYQLTGTMRTNAVCVREADRTESAFVGAHVGGAVSWQGDPATFAIDLHARDTRSDLVRDRGASTR